MFSEYPVESIEAYTKAALAELPDNDLEAVAAGKPLRKALLGPGFLLAKVL